MPGYKTHTVTNLIALSGVCYVASSQYAVSPSLVITGGVAFIVSTFFLSPDLDLKHSSPTRNWGLLRWLWRPYQMLFKHRGLSHSLLFSSMTRIGYLICLIGGALIATQAWADPSSSNLLDSSTSIAAPIASLITAHGEQLSAIGVGIAFSDTCHIITDRVASALKACFKHALW